MQYAKMRWLYVIGILCLTTSTSGDQPQIVIIGAGPSGIAAASKLYENGFQNVTILEAEDRIGGRVYTTRFDDSWIDLGGQWVAGERNNIVFELASPLGLLEIPPDNEKLDLTVYNSKGYQIPNSVSRNFIELYLDIVGNTEDLIGNNGSIGEYIERKINEEVKKFDTINETLTLQLMKLLEGLSMSSDASNNWYEVSVRGYRESWEYVGSEAMTWKDRGYGTILDILMKKYPNPEEELPVLNNTLLNSEVVNVNYQSIEGKAVVKTSDGKEYVADHVIMTPSLGVLKAQYETLFTPRLPESKVKTIKGLAYGTTAKIYLSFETPWWHNNSQYLGFVWDENDRQEYESDPNTKWLLDVIAIHAVAHRPRLLLAWVVGAGARYMETLPEDQVFNQTFALINKFLGNSYNITRPLGIKRTTWHNNKHFRGVYSYRSMESERADVWAEQLVAPLLVNDKPVVMFAGEATNAHHYGYVHGAIETGFREANRLIDLYANTTK